MIRLVEWQSFVRALDFTQLYYPLPFIRKYQNFFTLPNGVEFECLTAKWGKEKPVHLRVEVIFPDVLRLRMRQGCIMERPSDILVQDHWEAPLFHLQESESFLRLYTKRLIVDFPREPWQMKVYDRAESKQPFFEQQIADRCYGTAYEVPPIGFNEQNGLLNVVESIAVSPGEALYGFGEKFTSLNKWGQEFVSWAVDCGNVSSYRSYKNVPFWMSSRGYGVFVHTTCPIVFRIGSESALSYTFHVLADELDYFLIYGPKFKDILRRYADLTGHAPVPPKWSFGFWLSRCGYKSQREVEGIAAELRERGFPCDVISLDPWWMGEGPWTTFEWDNFNFPDPEGMIRLLKEQGIRTCLWIHPYLPEGSLVCKEAQARGYLIKRAEGTPSPVKEPFSGTELYAVDFTNPEAISWFQSILENLMAMGVAVFKTDFGEQAPVDAVYADGRSGLEMHNLYPLLYNRTVFELTRRRQGRGLVWGRSAYAGSQRYPVQWGGDSYASLDQMACQIRGLLSYGMSGVPFCGHDVGGFDYPPQAFDTSSVIDYPLDAEVYVRWLQFGVFSSHLRAHGKQPREPWWYGERVSQIAKDYLRLRYRLLPYIYTEAVQSSRKGLPMVRPLVLEYQHDRNTYNIDTQYLFGSAFLVAPVTNRIGCIPVYLPPGDWVDFWKKQLCKGGRWIKVEASLDVIPLWIKRGSILPLGPEMDYVDQKALDPLTLELYYPRGKKYLTIEDEDRPPVHVEYVCKSDSMRVRVSPVIGRVELVIYGLRVCSALLNDKLLPLKEIDSGFKISCDGREGLEILFLTG